MLALQRCGKSGPGCPPVWPQLLSQTGSGPLYVCVYIYIYIYKVSYMEVQWLKYMMNKFILIKKCFVNVHFIWNGTELWVFRGRQVYKQWCRWFEASRTAWYCSLQCVEPALQCVACAAMILHTHSCSVTTVLSSCSAYVL
jgi:hypothetical protein